MHYLEEELTSKYGFDSTILTILSNKVISGIWFWDLENPEEEYFDDQFWLTLGYDPKEMPQKSDVWQSLVFEEDLQLAIKLVQEHIENPSIAYKQVLRYKHKQGHTIYIHCTGQAVLREGKPVRLLGVHFDITRSHLRLKNLESFFTLNKDLAVLLNNEGIVIEANPKALKVLQIENTEIGNLSLIEALARRGFDLKELSELYNYSAKIKGLEGDLPLKISIIPNAENFLFLAHDQSNEIDQSAKLEVLNDLNKSLIAVSENFLQTDVEKQSFWELIRKSLEIMLPSLRADQVAIYSYEKNADNLVQQLYSYSTKGNETLSIKDNKKDYPLSFFEPWLERHELGESLLIDNLEHVESEELKSFLSTCQTKTHIAVPLFVEEGLVGFISVNWTSSIDYAPELLASLKLFTKLISEYWLRLSPHSKLIYQEQVTARVLDSIHLPFAIIDLNSSILSSNQMLGQLLGIASETTSEDKVELIDFLKRKDSKALLAVLNNLKVKEGKSIKIELETKKGLMPYEVFISKLEQNYGNPIKFLCECKDLTEFNTLKDESKEIQQLSQFLLEKSPLFILRYNQKTFVLDLINDRAESLLIENPWLKRLDSINHPFYKTCNLENWFKIDSLRAETSGKLAGREIDVEWDLLKEETDDKETIIWAFGRDYTFFHKNQKEAARKKRELEKTQSLANIGSYYYQLQSDEFYWSDQTYRIFEINGQNVSSPPNHFSFVIEEDQAKVENLLGSAKDGDMEFYSAHQIETAKGKVKHIEDRCELEFDLLGQVIAYRGVIKDVTEYRERQLELLEFNKDLIQANFLLEINAKITQILDSEMEAGRKDEKLLYTLGQITNVGQISLIIQDKFDDIKKSETYKVTILKSFERIKDSPYQPVPIKKSVHHLSYDLSNQIYYSGQIASCGILNPKILKPGSSLFTEQSWNKESEVFIIKANKQDDQIVLFCLETKSNFDWSITTEVSIQKIARNIKQYFKTQYNIQKLMVSEERFRLVNRINHSIIWEYKFDDNKVIRGEGIDRITGVNIKEAKAGLLFTDQIHPDDRKIVESNILKMKKGEVDITRFEFRVMHVNGHYSNIEGMAIAVKNIEGKVYKIIGSMIDRSESLEQKVLLQAAGTIANLAPVDIDLETKEFRNISQDLADIFDREIQHVSLLDDMTKFFNEKEGKWQSILEIITSNYGAKDSSMEVKMRTIKNSEKWIRVRYSISIKYNRAYRIIGIVQDITKDKQANIDLIESAFWLKKTQEIGKIGHFRINLETGQWTASDQLKITLGYPDDLSFDPMSWMSFVAPQYREELEDKYQKAIDEDQGFHMLFEIMVGLNPNKAKWLEIDTDIIKVNEERFLVGSSLDVTERIKLNDRLLKNQEKVKEISWKQSHLARGPLTRLITQSVEVLRNQNINEETKIVLESIIISAYEVDMTLKDSNSLVEKLDFTIEQKSAVFSNKHIDLHKFQGNQVTLFIVDDDPIICAMHHQILKRAGLGCEIQVFDSGLKLLEKLKYDKDRLNLILLDINMPGLSGIEVLAEITKIESKMNSFVIMVSSSISTNDKIGCASYPFVLDFYEKPFNTGHLQRLKGLPFFQSDSNQDTNT
jgi:PAS domain-containing protein/CheY-like chemotaxis protein